MSKVAAYQRRLGVGLEGTLGNIASIRRLIPTDELTLDFVKERRLRESFGVNAVDMLSYSAESALTVNITMPLQHDSLGDCLLALCGTCASAIETGAAGGTQYKHTFTMSGTMDDKLPSLTFKDYTGAIVRDYTGVRLGRMVVSAAAPEIWAVTFEGVGQQELAGTAAPATITYGTGRPATFADFSYMQSGTAGDSLYNFELTVDRQLGDGYRLGTQTFPVRHMHQKTMVDFGYNVEETTVERLRYLNGSNMDCLVSIAGDTIVGTGKNELKFKMPKTFYKTAPFEYQDDSMRGLSVAGAALEGGTNSIGTSHALVIELFNAVGSYTL